MRFPTADQFQEMGERYISAPKFVHVSYCFYSYYYYYFRFLFFRDDTIQTLHDAAMFLSCNAVLHEVMDSLVPFCISLDSEKGNTLSTKRKEERRRRKESNKREQIPDPFCLSPAYTFNSLTQKFEWIFNGRIMDGVFKLYDFLIFNILK